MLKKMFLLLIIILSGSIYMVLWSNILSLITIVVVVAICCIELQNKVKVKLLLSYLIVSIGVGAILLLHYTLVPYQNDLISYLTFYTRIIVIGLFLVILKNSGQFNILHSLEKILKLIAIHAALSFVFSFFLGSFLFNITTEKIYTNTFFYLFFYNSSFELFGITFYRNQGVFWEPGILQIYMNLLFFISSFIFKNRKFQLLTAFLIVTTYSTTGIAILLIQVLTILFSNNVSRKQRMLIVTSLAILILPLFVLNYTSKVRESNESSTDVTSSVLRFYDFIEGYHIIVRHPLTGIGLAESTYMTVKNQNNSLFSAYSSEFIDAILERRSSNSIMYFLSRFGLVFSLFWFYFLYNQQIVHERKLLFFVIILFSNLSEPLIMTPFFILLCCSSLYKIFNFNFEKRSYLLL